MAKPITFVDFLRSLYDADNPRVAPPPFVEGFAPPMNERAMARNPVGTKPKDKDKDKKPRLSPGGIDPRTGMKYDPNYVHNPQQINPAMPDYVHNPQQINPAMPDYVADPGGRSQEWINTTGKQFIPKSIPKDINEGWRK